MKVLAATLEGADVTALRESVDKLRDKLGTAAVVLGRRPHPNRGLDVRR